MTPLSRITPFVIASCLPLRAETVIITTVPDDTHPLEPLTSFGGIPLDETAQIRIGAFPGISNDQLLDLAAGGGLTAVSARLVSFGATAAIGEGVDGAAGGFEIAVRDTGAAALDGEVISLLLQTPDREFLVARFTGRRFEPQTDTGLEPLHTLHFADAELITGSRVGTTNLSTSPAPVVGSYATWLAEFPSITDPALRLPAADADGDGRSNFLEWATGGNPTAPGDAPACDLLADGAGGLWVRFRRLPGLGSVRYTPQFSADLQSSWLATALPLEPDPGNLSILRLHLAPPLSPARFFRLLVEPPQPD